MQDYFKGCAVERVWTIGLAWVDPGSWRQLGQIKAIHRKEKTRWYAHQLSRVLATARLSLSPHPTPHLDFRPEGGAGGIR